MKQGVKGELLKLAGSLLLVYGRDVPELAEGADTMLGWCDTALQNDTKNKRVYMSKCMKGTPLCVLFVCRGFCCVCWTSEVMQCDESALAEVATRQRGATTK